MADSDEELAKIRVRLLETGRNLTITRSKETEGQRCRDDASNSGHTTPNKIQRKVNQIFNKPPREKKNFQLSGELTQRKGRKEIYDEGNNRPLGLPSQRIKKEMTTRPNNPDIFRGILAMVRNRSKQSRSENVIRNSVIEKLVQAPTPNRQQQLRSNEIIDQWELDQRTQETQYEIVQLDKTNKPEQTVQSRQITQLATKVVNVTATMLEVQRSEDRRLDTPKLPPRGGFIEGVPNVTSHTGGQQVRNEHTVQETTTNQKILQWSLIFNSRKYL